MSRLSGSDVLSQDPCRHQASLQKELPTDGRTDSSSEPGVLFIIIFFFYHGTARSLRRRLFDWCVERSAQCIFVMQKILKILPTSKREINVNGQVSIKFRIDDVSKNHMVRHVPHYTTTTSTTILLQ